jgi:hypothetical protein
MEAPGSPGAKAHARVLWRSALRQALRFHKASAATRSWVDLSVSSEACVRWDYDAGAWRACTRAACRRWFQRIRCSCASERAPSPQP